VLPKAARMSNSADFRQTVRHGVRVGRPTLVVHAQASPTEGVRVGFVVSKTVGNAVTRNRVKRRLRHLSRAALPATPAGVALVVRALPRAAVAPAELPNDLQAAWAKALQRLLKQAQS
jgi:ribonuclease P protein component